MSKKAIFYCNDTQSDWGSSVALCDLVAFFASVEQLDFPELQGKPIVITNGEAGTTIITSSYECRTKGIKTGMKLKEALKLCPELIKRASRPDRYVALSTKVINAVKDNISPDIEVFSIDEMYIDLYPVLSYYGSVQVIADKLRKTVFDASGGINCSIGISEGKLTAKYCAKLHKGGTTIIPPGKIKAAMADAPIGSICGIGKQTEKYLNARGVKKCDDVEKLPMAVFSKKFGDIGRRLYSVCLGHDFYPVITRTPDPKSMSHGKILPPYCADKRLIFGIMKSLCERLGARLRLNDQNASLLYAGFKTDLGWIGEKIKPVRPTQCSNDIWTIANSVLKNWNGQSVFQLYVSAIKLESAMQMQLDFFLDNNESKESQLDKLRDAINTKLGKGTLITGTELAAKKGNMVAVISPAWQPDGGRQSI